MKKRWIVLGDKTTHGGSVISCTATTVTTMGHVAARIGDKVWCQKCRKMTTIISGDPTFIIMGQPVAYEGCYTSCGAQLVSVQQSASWVGDEGGDIADEASPDNSALAEALLAAKKPICIECLLTAALKASPVLGR